MRTLLLAGLAAAVAACGGGDDTTCGTGTVEMDGMCVPVEGSGNDTSCGTGTHLEGTSCVPDDTTTCGAGTHLDNGACVPDDNGEAAAPTVASIDPPNAGIGGSVLFTITGTGFAGTNVNDLHVFFGDPTDMNCEAQLGAATATTLSGEVPPGCTLSSSVTVTVTTNLGSATIPFQYEMIFAADGDAGGSIGLGGEVWLIDPFSGLSFDLGSLSDADQNAYGFSGMDFDANGTFYAVTTGDSPGDVDIVSQLMTIDLATGAPTVIGEALDASDNGYYVTDIKFVNGTLYGWGYWYDGTDFERSLVSINTADATVTQIGTGTVDSTFSGGMAVDGTGTLLAAINGAGADANSAVPTTGEISSVDTATGNHSQVAVMDWPVGSPIMAMTTFQASQPVVLGAVDNGTYGVWNDMDLFGVTLALIDVANETVQPILELPAVTGTQSHVDALAVPPATLTISRKLPRAGWTQLDGARLAR